MRALLKGLDNGFGVSVGSVEIDMMKEHCECGRSMDEIGPWCAGVQESCAYHFSNMEDWNRSTIIPFTEI